MGTIEEASSGHSYKYDVFLSYITKDTGDNFTGHLYKAFDREAIRTFKDDEELGRGEELSPTLVEAIEGSRFLVIVFSKNYASSTWCLDEVVKIIDCWEAKKGQEVRAVFYHVEPSNVKDLTGGYGKALEEHEEKFKNQIHKVQKWRSALNKAANLTGWYLANQSESAFIEEIVEEISIKLDRTCLFVAKYPVGIDSHIQELELQLDLKSNDVRMIGIYGPGRIGKTTIVKALFNLLTKPNNLITKQFDGSCFLPNISKKCEREGLEDVSKLQEMVLKDILRHKRHSEINFDDRGINVIRERLCGKRVLIVLDDVDHIIQLQKLAGNTNWFGPGSRIIITTRKKELLDDHGVEKTYKVEKLNNDDALTLFSWNAFVEPRPSTGFEKLSNHLVEYADGHPLALSRLGASLNGVSKVEWESKLQKLGKFSKSSMKKLKSKVKAVNTHKKNLQSRIEGEVKPGEKLREEVEVWLAKVEKIREEKKFLKIRLEEGELLERANLGNSLCAKLEELEDEYEKINCSDTLVADEHSKAAKGPKRKRSKVSASAKNEGGGDQKIVMNGIGGVGNVDINNTGNPNLTFGNFNL